MFAWIIYWLTAGVVLAVAQGAATVKPTLNPAGIGCVWAVITTDMMTKSAERKLYVYKALRPHFFFMGVVIYLLTAATAGPLLLVCIFAKVEFLGKTHMDIVLERFFDEGDKK